MKFPILALVFFSFAAQAQQPSFTIPKPNPGATTPVVFGQRNLNSDSRVHHYFFSVTAPKGWSFKATGYAAPQLKTADQSDAILELTPSFPMEKSTTRVDIRTVRKSTVTSIDKLYSQLISNKTKTVKMLTWHGNRWVLEKYRTPDKKSEVWGMIGIFNQVQFKVFAQTPYAHHEKVEKTLMNLFGSIETP